MKNTARDVFAEALFASELQMAQRPDLGAVRNAIMGMLRRHGSEGCAALMATEFGDHPECAARRMVWAKRMAGAADLATPTRATPVNDRSWKARQTGPSKLVLQRERHPGKFQSQVR